MSSQLGEHLDIARAIHEIGSHQPDQAFVHLGVAIALLQRDLVLYLFDCTDLARTTAPTRQEVLQ